MRARETGWPASPVLDSKAPKDCMPMPGRLCRPRLMRRASGSSSGHVAAAPSGPACLQSAASPPAWLQNRCFRCLEPGHRIAVCCNQVKCRRCFGFGHRERTCTNNPSPLRPVSPPPAAPRRASPTLTAPRAAAPPHAACPQAVPEAMAPPKMGDPETHLAEVFSVVHATPEMLQEEALLSTNAAVAWLNRDMRVSTADIAKLVGDTVGALPGHVEVVRHHPEAFLITFIHVHHCSNAVWRRELHNRDRRDDRGDRNGRRRASSADGAIPSGHAAAAPGGYAAATTPGGHATAAAGGHAAASAGLDLGAAADAAFGVAGAGPAASVVSCSLELGLPGQGLVVESTSPTEEVAAGGTLGNGEGLDVVSLRSVVAVLCAAGITVLDEGHVRAGRCSQRHAFRAAEPEVLLHADASARVHRRHVFFCPGGLDACLQLQAGLAGSHAPLPVAPSLRDNTSNIFAAGYTCCRLAPSQVLDAVARPDNLFAPLVPSLLPAPASQESPRPPSPAGRSKTLAGGFTVRRSSIRIRTSHKGTPIAKMAKKNLSRRLGILEENEDVTGAAVQEFVNMFASQVPSNAVASMCALFCLDCAHAAAVEAALLSHGGQDALDLEVQGGA
ncbi:hypothetical protein ACQ4PT_070619 [Festuca glaucescens]